MAQAAASSSRLVFADQNREPVKVWLDPSLPSFIDLAPLLRLNGAILASSPAEAAIIILYPRSTAIFDLYCHEAWLPDSKQVVERAVKWEGKVIVTERWPKLCVAAGRLLGLADDWGGYRLKATAVSTTRPLPKAELEITPIPSTSPASTLINASAGPSEHAQSRSDTETAAPPSNATTSTSVRFPLRYNWQKQKYTVDELEEALRNAHPMCLFQGVTPVDLGKHVKKSRPKIESNTWRRLYINWLGAAKRFEPLAKETGHLAYIDVFQGYLPLLRQGASLRSISDRLVRDHPGEGKSSTAWNTLLGGWLRKMPPDVPLPFPATRDSPHISAGTSVEAKAPLPASASQSSSSTPSPLPSPEAPIRAKNTTLLSDYPAPSRSARNLPTARLPHPTASSSSTSKQLHYPLETLDEIMRNAHPMRLMRGMTVRAMGKHLGSKHEKLSSDSWRRVYTEWLDGTGRFPPSDRSTYLPHVEAFERYLPQIQKGASLTSIADKLAKAQTGPKLSSAEWNVLLGGWLRNMPPEIATRTDLAGGSSAEHTSALRPTRTAMSAEGAARRKLLAEVFKRDYDTTEPRVVEDLAKEVGAKYGLHPRTMEAWYRRWRTGHERFRDIPEELRPSVLWDGAGPAVTSTPKRKRRRSTTISESSESDDDSSSETPALHIAASRDPTETKERRLMLAKIFKEEYDNTDVRGCDIGRQVAVKTGHSARNVEKWYGLWVRNHERFSVSIPAELRPAVPRTARNKPSIPPSTPSASIGAASTLRADKRRKTHFTNGEESAMVAYIQDRRPMDTEPCEEDWMDFADEYPARTAEDYAQHHLLHRARIDGLLADLNEHVEETPPASISPDITTPRSSRRMSSVATRATRTPPAKRGGHGRQGGVVIDLTMSDDDD